MGQNPGDAEGEALEGTRVLLVEDEARLRAVVTMMLEEPGAEVVAVAGGEEAIGEFSAGHRDIDLVLLDVKLAGLSSAQLFDELVAVDPAVRVVFTSGVEPDAEIQGKIQRGRGSFIEKPYTIDQLADVLGGVLHAPRG